MHRNRRGEKLGWSLGWMGGFVWVIALGVSLAVQGKVLKGLLGIVLVGLAAVVIWWSAPWRHTETVYWKLMIGPYAVFFLSIVWGIWAFGGLELLDLNWWNLLWIVPVLGPFGMIGTRKWKDGEPQESR